jgi:hypothetical protein
MAKVHDPDSPDDPSAEWDEDEPDFLMTKVKAVDRFNLQAKIALLAIGPIGHTLDSTASSFPKFLSSSWIIRPNLSNVSNPPDLSWWFANLQNPDEGTNSVNPAWANMVEVVKERVITSAVKERRRRSARS